MLYLWRINITNAIFVRIYLHFFENVISRYKKEMLKYVKNNFLKTSPYLKVKLKFLVLKYNFIFMGYILHR